MKYARWLDHLPPWIAYGAVATTGIYEPWEVVAMGVPLALGGLAELLRVDLSRWRLPLELATVAWLALDLIAHKSFFAQLVRVLFILAGLRLALPRKLPHRRQLLLISFLLFLTTAISTADLSFMGWAVLWLLAATMALLEQSWEHSASLRHGPAPPPPWRRVPLWATSSLLLAGGFFMVLPRLTLGIRPLPSLAAGLGVFQAGLSDRVDLGDQGPITPNPTVVMRLVPPQGLGDSQRAALGQDLGLLRGLALESVSGMRWEPTLSTPPLDLAQGTAGRPESPGSSRDLVLELNLNPMGQGSPLPVPYGTTVLQLPFQRPLVHGAGGLLRWPFPTTNAIPLSAFWDPDRAFALREGPPMGRRRALLTQLAPEHEAARQASLRWAPGALPSSRLAETLVAHLHSFHYSLENPSGRAANPISDFLEHSQTGHCEYFASSLALMLRARNVPARVVNGYRLGAWNSVGGYWEVTQNEAHSWVEYYDEEGQRWRVADPTPPIAAEEDSGLLATWNRWSDALRFEWNRYVVRYSDEDQQSALGKAQSYFSGWHWNWKSPSPLAASALGLALLGWAVYRFRPRRGPAFPAQARGLRSLRPLLHRVPLQPLEGETARAWLQRLAAQRPDRAAPLAKLSEAVDLAAYGDGAEAALRPLVREELRAWKRRL